LKSILLQAAGNALAAAGSNDIFIRTRQGKGGNHG
jgi:hypothetical protein